jgi:hypothetical protein
MYKLVYNKYILENNYVIKLVDNLQIPFDLANSDYQAYLKWVSEGGVPLPADE